MATVHYAYNVLKIPGPAGVISIKADVKGSVHCTERLFEVVVAAFPNNRGRPESSAHPSAKQRLSPNSAALTKTVHLRDDPEKTVSIGTELGEK